MWGNKNTINKTSAGRPARDDRQRAGQAKAAPARAAREPAKKLRKLDKAPKAAPAVKASRKEKAARGRQAVPPPRAVREGKPVAARQAVRAPKAAPAGQAGKATRSRTRVDSSAATRKDAAPAAQARAKPRERAPEPVKKKRAATTGKARLLLRLSPRTVIIILLFVIFIALSASPVARNLEATGQLKAMERELATQRKTTAALEKEIDQARSPSYIEEEARLQRMVAPGEVLYLVTTDAAEPKVEYRLKALQSMDEAWEMIRKVLHCNAPRQ
jgi:cell division protein FtsB